jgi:hypothetical protein
MQIDTRALTYIFEIEVFTGSATIKEDVAVMRKHGKGAYVPGEVIQQFVDVAHEAIRFNGTSDVDFVLEIIDSILNKTEKQQLIDLLTEQD